MAKLHKLLFLCTLVISANSIYAVINSKGNNARKIQRLMDPELVITEHKKNVTAKVFIGDFQKEDVTVRVRNGALWIIAQKDDENEEVDINYYASTTSDKNFEIMEDLPCEVDASRMKWDLSEDGELTVDMPKA